MAGKSKTPSVGALSARLNKVLSGMAAVRRAPPRRAPLVVRTVAKRARVGPRAMRAVGEPPGVAAAYAQGVKQNEPKITRGKDWVRISHKELILNLTGSTNFTVAGAFPLNPGMTTFLKWLPTQAVGWETYEWHSIVCESLTRTGSNVPGSIQICPDYDASDAAPVDEFSESSYKDLCEDAPWKTIRCVMPGSRLHPNGKKFIRYGAVANTDVKTYDAGNLFITTTDGTAVAWSKVWVHYDVTLYTPQLPPGGMVTLSNMLHLTGTTPTTANSFPNQTVGVGSNAGIATVPITGEIITFNVPGRYLVVYSAAATTSVTITGAPAVSASGKLVTTYGFGTGEAGVGSGTIASIQTVVLDAVAGTTLTFDNTFVLGTFWELTITGFSSLAA